MFSEIINSIKANLYDRIVSPLSGAFVIAFLITNYKAVLLLLDDQNYYIKLHYLESALYPDVSTVLVMLFLAPAISSALFILIYPLPSRFAYGYWLNQQRKLKTLKVKIESEIPLTLEESRKLRRQLAVLEHEFNQELVEKDRELEELKAIIVKYEQPDTQGETNTKDSNDTDFDQSQTVKTRGGNGVPDEPAYIVEQEKGLGKGVNEVLKRLAAHSEGISIKNLVGETGHSPIRIEYILEQLNNAGYITTFMGNNQTLLAKLSEEGKNFVLKEDIV